MSQHKYFLPFLFSLFTSVAFSQVRNFDISTPVGIEAVGLNKVLCMKSGNTVLFHFEPGKGIMVKVFDTGHKRVANTEHLCTELDITMLRTFVFKGLYDIAGEAVLFIEQQNSGRHSLVRLRFNADNGRLIEEKTVGRSKSMAKPMKFFVMKNKNEENYAILFSTEIPQFKDCEQHVTYYNSRHEQYKELPLKFERKKFDYMEVVGAEALTDGICISLGLSTLLLNGTGDHVRSASLMGTQQPDDLSAGVGSSMENASIYGHHLAIFFIGKDSTHAVSKMIDVSSEVFPYYSCSSYNPFAKTVNLLLLSYRDAIFRYGLELRPTALTANLFFKLDDENLGTEYTWLNNKMASKNLQERTDTSNYFKGLPVKLFTNDNGLSTLVSESFSRYKNIETRARADVYESYFGDLAVTQFDDNGRELWGTVLPRSQQFYKSYRHYYHPADMAKRWQQQELFGDLPPQVYNRQFVSSNSYSKGSDIYVVYNDYTKNVHAEEDPADTVFTFDHTNACYYKINKKKEVSRQFMFGEPLAKEYKTSFIEGADFDEERGVYATLMQYKRGEYVSLRMGWRRLD